MKTPIIWGLLLLVAAVAFDNVNGSVAEQCEPERCRLPECRCSGTDIPGGIRPRSVPQFVTLTFDDAITSINMVTYRRLLYNRRNSNNCPIGTTFYMSHEYTDYQAVNELYNRGFEIALHSITHKDDQEYWKNADYETLVKEFVDQRTQVAHFANIPSTAVKGIRMPFLQMAGDPQFIMMANHSMLYDASMATINLVNPGLWPYTLHYRSIQECNVPPCPTSSIHGPWVLPILAWRDLENFPCPFVDACSRGPNFQDEEGWYDFFQKNFENHYLGNRAPFGFYVHEAFIRTHPAVERALARFLNLLNSLHDVFMVNSEEVIAWVKNPVPLTEYRQQGCRAFPVAPCRAGNPCRIRSDHNGNTYYMPVCTACPRRYPWIGNPLGLW